MLMFLSLSAPHDLNEVDWNGIYDVWKQIKARKPLPLGQIHVFNDVILNVFEEYQMNGRKICFLINFLMELERYLFIDQFY